MGEKNMEELHKIVGNLSSTIIEKNENNQVALRIEHKEGQNFKDLIKTVHQMKGGMIIKFDKEGKSYLVGGLANAKRTKKIYEEAVASGEFNENEKQILGALLDMLDQYIEKLMDRNPDKDPDKDPDKNPDKNPDKDPDKDPDKKPNKKGNNGMKLDLDNVKGTENVKKQMEEFKAEADRIEGKAAMEEVLDEIRRAKHNIERYKKELEDLPTTLRYKRMDHVESRLEEASLKETIAAYEKRLEDAEKRKAELDKKKDSPENKREKNALYDKKAAFYTQAKMKFENEIDLVKHEMQGILLSMRSSQDGATIKGLNDRYASLQDKLTDLQNAIKLCDEQKSLLKAELEQSIQSIQEIISRKPEAGKSEPEKDDKDNKEKPEGAEKDNNDNKDKDKDKPEGGEKDDKDNKDKGNLENEQRIAELIQQAENILRGIKVKVGAAEQEVNKLKEEAKRLPVLINGEKHYEDFDILSKFEAKRRAYMIENNLEDESEVGILQNLRLLLPSRRYREQAIDDITHGRIAVTDIDPDIQEDEIETITNKQPVKGIVEAQAKEKMMKSVEKDANAIINEMKNEKDPEKVAKLKESLDKKAKDAGVEIVSIKGKDEKQKDNKEQEGQEQDL